MPHLAKGENLKVPSRLPLSQWVPHALEAKNYANSFLVQLNMVCPLLLHFKVNVFFMRSLSICKLYNSQH